VEAGGWDQVSSQFGLHNPLLNQFVKGVEIWGPPTLGVTFCVYEVVL